ncbi:MAG: UDP-glucose 4-epimerase GalE [Planctomycetes bacterium]|nr:UDP-glucose 4-epimerase GalE [Planctomycetota bacterium]
MGPMMLVTGGAGYIGSHVALALREAGFRTLVLDDFSEGHRDALLGGAAVAGSLLDPAFLQAVFAEHEITAVLHFGGRCYVGESVTDPGRYYHHNVVGTKNLLDAMRAAGVRALVFSSTCATYGEPATMPIVETMPQVPVNPYGHTKLVCEFLLRDYARAYGLCAVALRYFNAAGADPAGRLGEDHRPETHLIPLVLAAAAGRPVALRVFGDDYPTPDGTCIRDYVHVTDLASAHVLALQSLLAGRTGFSAFNLGNAQGSSVREVIAAAVAATGRPVPHTIAPRRAGDPPVLVGSPDKIRRELGWLPQHSDLATIVSTAWRWHQAHPEGYAR